MTSLHPKGIENDDKRHVFRSHHLILAALDPNLDLYNLVSRFTAYCGYWHRGKCCFTRPDTHCEELKEELDSEEDGLTGACKTDGEHGLGSCFHNLWAVWRCNHQVNKWFCEIRERSGDWLHPYVEEPYGKTKKDRKYPSFYKNW